MSQFFLTVAHSSISKQPSWTFRREHSLQLITHSNRENSAINEREVICAKATFIIVSTISGIILQIFLRPTSYYFIGGLGPRKMKLLFNALVTLRCLSVELDNPCFMKTRSFACAVLSLQYKRTLNAARVHSTFYIPSYPSYAVYPYNHHFQYRFHTHSHERILIDILCISGKNLTGPLRMITLHESQCRGKIDDKGETIMRINFIPNCNDNELTRVEGFSETDVIKSP